MIRFFIGIFIIQFVVVYGNTFAQNTKRGILKEDIIDIKDVLSSDTLVYFGLDFSKLQLVDAQKVGTEIIVNKYFGAWINYIEQSSIRNGALSVLLDNKVVLENTEQVQNLFKNKMNENYIYFTRTPLILDSIQEIVNNYNLPKFNNKIGFVIILETFDKLTDRAIINFTFFDITSKKVLWRIKSTGPAYGIGMTNHWGRGSENAIFFFGNHFKTKMSAYHSKK